ncbi:MAG: heme NO-binding domain-containing protein [Gemmatimonadota bacterium]
MKGVIFNLLEAFVCERWGEEAYESLLDRTTLVTGDPFVGPGTYPDADLTALVKSAAELLDLPVPEVLRAFGEFCFPKLAGRVPDLVDDHPDLISFLESVDTVLHVEVTKLIPQAVTPSFLVEPTGPGQARLQYTSERKLCAFMEGLLVGAARHFECEIDYAKHSCMHEGAVSCEYEVVVRAPLVTPPAGAVLHQ